VQSTRVLAALAEPDGELGQAVAVLEAAGVEDALRLPVSQGDRELVALTCCLTGEDLRLVAECTHCALLNEATLAPESLAAPAPRVAALRRGGIREPTYADLLDLPAEEDEATDELLRRCTVAKPERRPTAAALELVDDTLSGPIVLACSGCDEPITVDADVQQLALARLGALARELDREVHLLAGEYGWSLTEIDALPDARRRRLATLVSEGR
jgi:hypothetical protein